MHRVGWQDAVYGEGYTDDIRPPAKGKRKAAEPADLGSLKDEVEGLDFKVGSFSRGLLRRGRLLEWLSV